jgi:hypothetical protein
MNYAFFVGGGECVGDVFGDFDDLRGRKTTGMGEAVERLAFDEFHGEEVDTVGFFDGEDGDDVRVVERGDRAGFALEFCVGGAIDLAHAAGAEGADDSIVR